MTLKDFNPFRKAWLALVFMVMPAATLMASEPMPVTIFLNGFYTVAGSPEDRKMQDYMTGSYRERHPDWDRRLVKSGFRFRNSRVGTNHPGCFIPDLTDGADIDLEKEAEVLYGLIHGTNGLAVQVREKFGAGLRITWVATSAGALKYREYLRLCRERKVADYSGDVYFIAGAQNGSDIALDTEAYFNRLLAITFRRFRESMATNAFVQTDPSDPSTRISYREIYEKTWIRLLESDEYSSKFLRSVLTYALLHWVPFDRGHTLGDLTVLGQLSPNSRLVRNLNEVPFPQGVRVVNLVSRNPSSTLFMISQEAMEKTGKPALSDGFLSADNSFLNGRNIKEIVCEKPADHCKLVMLDASADLPGLIAEKYGVLRYLLNDFGLSRPETENRAMIRAFFLAMFSVLGYVDMEEGKKGNYSILDYFMEKDFLARSI